MPFPMRKFAMSRSSEVWQPVMLPHPIFIACPGISAAILRAMANFCSVKLSCFAMASRGALYSPANSLTYAAPVSPDTATSPGASRPFSDPSSGTPTFNETQRSTPDTINTRRRSFIRAKDRGMNGGRVA